MKEPDVTRPRECAAVFCVHDVVASLQYYEQALGFQVAFTWGEPVTYAGVCRGAVTIHLQAEGVADRPAGASVLSIFVADADAVYADLRERGARIVKPPATYPYGMRDFDVTDPDGNRIVFGNPVPTG